MMNLFLRHQNLLKQNPSLAKLCLGFCLCLTMAAHAAEFRSVVEPKLVTYDAPSASAKQKYIISQGYPLEVVVDLGEWVKVRDQKRGLSWVQGNGLDTKRTVLVTEATDIKVSEQINAALLATVEQDVVLELLSTKVSQGWVKVKHQDGIEGYIRANTIWGLY